MTDSWVECDKNKTSPRRKKAHSSLILPAFDRRLRGERRPDTSCSRGNHSAAIAPSRSTSASASRLRRSRSTSLLWTSTKCKIAREMSLLMRHRCRRLRFQFVLAAFLNSYELGFVLKILQQVGLVDHFICVNIFQCIQSVTAGRNTAQHKFSF